MAGPSNDTGGAPSPTGSSTTPGGVKTLQCTHPGCDKVYTRKEHLARHAKSHLPDAGYVCEVCDKKFSRQDVLLRHRRQHNNDEGASERRLAALKRTKRACDRCSAAKLRCDGGQPCDRCRTMNKDCSYAAAAAAAAAAASAGGGAASRSTKSGDVEDDSRSTRSSSVYSPGSPNHHHSDSMNGGVAGDGGNMDFSYYHMTGEMDHSKFHFSITGNGNGNGNGIDESNGHHHGMMNSLINGEHPTATHNSYDHNVYPNQHTMPASFSDAFDPKPGSASRPDGSTTSTYHNNHPISPFTQLPPLPNLSNSGGGASTSSAFHNATPASVGSQGTVSTTTLSQADSSLFFGVSATSPSKIIERNVAAAANNTTFFDFNSLLFGASPSDPAQQQTLLPVENDLFGWSGLSSGLAGIDDMYFESLLNTASGNADGMLTTDMVTGATVNSAAHSGLLPLDFVNQPHGTTATSSNAVATANNFQSHASPHSDMTEAMKALMNLAAEGQGSNNPDGSARKSKGPPLHHGLHTRASSPNLVQDHDSLWPETWNPATYSDTVTTTQQESKLIIPDMENQSAETDRNIPELPEAHKVDESARLALLELLRFAELKIETFHHLYVRLSRISLDILNSYMRLYFHYVQPMLPFCHIPTFCVRQTSGFLLAGMLAIGAQYSKIPGSNSFSLIIGDIINAAVGTVVSANNKLSRENQIWQSLIQWSLLRYTGNRRLVELTEAFRSTYTTGLHRMHAWDGGLVLPKEVLNAALPLDRRWNIWRYWEGRRRTGLACFLTDAELVVNLNRPPLIPPKQMGSTLPCADALWEAKTAQEWASLLSPDNLSADGPPISRFLDFKVTNLRLINRSRMSTLGSCVLIQSLQVSVCSLRQIGSFSDVLVRAMQNDLKRALLALGGGPNEFCINNAITSQSSFGWTAFEVLYHQTHLQLRLPTANLLSIVNNSAEPARQARAEIMSLLMVNTTTCREMALHAGRIIKLVRASRAEAPHEVFALLFAGLTLHLYASVVQEKVRLAAAEGKQQEFAAEHHSIALDADAVSAIETNWVNSESMAASVSGIALHTPTASKEVLSLMISIFKVKKTWGFASVFVQILERMKAMDV